MPDSPTLSSVGALNELIASELGAIRLAVEARGPVDIDVLAKRIVELGKMETATAGRGHPSATTAEGLAPPLREPWEQRAAVVADDPIRRGDLRLAGEHAQRDAGNQVIESGRFAGRTVDELRFVNNLLVRAGQLNPATVQAPSAELSDVVKRAESATGTATGAEYVPTGMAQQLWIDMFLQSRVVANLSRIAMPTNPFDLPLGWGVLAWRKGTRNVQSTPQDPPTAKGTLTATEQVMEVDWDYTLDEDSVIAIMPTLRTELTREGAEQMDAFCLNADKVTAATGNVMSDDGAPPADGYYLADGQDGARKLYLVDNTAQSASINATLTDTHMLAAFGRMAKYAADPKKLLLVCDAKSYLNGLMGIANVRTREKYGEAATVVAGELAQFGGVPVIISESMPLAKVNGKVSVTAANNTFGQIAILNRDMWRVGFRRELLVEIDRDIKKRQFIMVISFRMALASRGARATSTHTAGIHGISV